MRAGGRDRRPVALRLTVPPTLPPPALPPMETDANKPSLLALPALPPPPPIDCMTTAAAKSPAVPIVEPWFRVPVTAPPSPPWPPLPPIVTTTPEAPPPSPPPPPIDCARTPIAEMPLVLMLLPPSAVNETEFPSLWNGWALPPTLEMRPAAEPPAPPLPPMDWARTPCALDPAVLINPAFVTLTAPAVPLAPPIPPLLLKMPYEPPPEPAAPTRDCARIPRAVVPEVLIEPWFVDTDIVGGTTGATSPGGCPRHRCSRHYCHQRR